MADKNQKSPPNWRAGLPRIRTLETDIEIRKKSGISPSDVVARSGILTEKKLDIKKIAVIAVLALAVGGTAFGLFKYFSREEQITKSMPSQVQIGKSYIKTDLEKTLNFSQLDPGSLISTIKKELETQRKSDSLLFLVLPQTPREFSQFTGIKIPESLLQNSHPSFNVFTAYHTGSSSVVFLIKTENFEKAYSSMLFWEKDMWQSFSQFLSAENIKNISKFSFSDEITRNHDSRILSARDGSASGGKNSANKSILAYAIFNKQFVIITTSREALSIMLQRLIASPPK